jgi:GPI mannosyltransferase 3
LVLLLSIISDRWFYGTWTLPVVQFLYFNITQGIAIFYGSNRLDYYFTEGFGLLLTTALPFAIYGVGKQLSQTFKSLRGHGVTIQDIAPCLLSWTILFVALALSLISHKEVRFLYPTIPALHLLSALPLSTFIRTKRLARFIIPLLIACNVVIALYVTLVHQRGVIDVTHYLRREHEARMAKDGAAVKTTVGILMPCHSTPWRSHLVHPDINVWALTCEPPLDVPLDRRASYLDEADQFYADPTAWMAENMGSLKGLKGMKRGAGGKREWPEKLVFFEQLKPAIQEFLGKTAYRECWRGFNSHWHDDWRRKGDVVVLCRS